MIDVCINFEVTILRIGVTGRYVDFLRILGKPAAIALSEAGKPLLHTWGGFPWVLEPTWTVLAVFQAMALLAN